VWGGHSCPPSLTFSTQLPSFSQQPKSPSQRRRTGVSAPHIQVYFRIVLGCLLPPSAYDFLCSLEGPHSPLSHSWGHTGIGPRHNDSLRIRPTDPPGPRPDTKASGVVPAWTRGPRPIFSSFTLSRSCPKDAVESNARSQRPRGGTKRTST
jgi:hypothetical protein